MKRRHIEIFDLLQLLGREVEAPLDEVDQRRERRAHEVVELVAELFPSGVGARLARAVALSERNICSAARGAGFTRCWPCAASGMYRSVALLPGSSAKGRNLSRAK